MLNLTPISIAPAELDSSRRWSLNQDLPLAANDTLAASINRISFLHPPIVRQLRTAQKSTESYEIICGTRRVAAARKLPQVEQIFCLQTNDAIDTNQLLTLIAEEQMLTGPLSPIQTARLIALAAECDPQPDSDFIKHLTGLHSITIRQQLMDLLSLDESIRTAIHEGKCSVQTGLFLLKLTQSDRSLLFDIFSKLSLNANKQRRLIDLCRIIAANRQCTIADIFKTDYPEMIDKPIDNIPQKSALLMKSLYHTSHPLSSRAEETFNVRMKEVKLPGNCRIRHSPSFEQDTVTLEIDFPRFEDFENNWRKIKHYWD